MKEAPPMTTESKGTRARVGRLPMQRELGLGAGQDGLHHLYKYTVFTLWYIAACFWADG